MHAGDTEDVEEVEGEAHARNNDLESTSKRTTMAAMTETTKERLVVETVKIVGI